LLDVFDHIGLIMKFLGKPSVAILVQAETAPLCPEGGRFVLKFA